jgi:protein-S-isoprenylcysteine O-methyltransferase Ste14
MIELLVLAGWGTHLAHWATSLAAARRAAARPTEWRRELIVRAAMLVGVIAAVGAGPAGRVPLTALLTAAVALLFLAGHAVAIAARATLAGAWSIGTRPRAGATRRRAGLYGALRHPIYAGVLLALAMQLVLLQNAASLVLLLGAVIVVPVKIVAEERWLARSRSATAD